MILWDVVLNVTSSLAFLVPNCYLRNINKKTWYRQTGIVNHEPRSIRSLTVYLITYIVYIIVIILSFLIRQLSLA